VPVKSRGKPDIMNYRSHSTASGYNAQEADILLVAKQPSYAQAFFGRAHKGWGTVSTVIGLELLLQALSYGNCVGRYRKTDSSHALTRHGVPANHND
jgi:hypothetical protein